MMSDQARAAGFVGGTDEPLAPKLSELEAYVARNIPAEEVYPLESCSFSLSNEDLVSIQAVARQHGVTPFSMTRVVGFHL